MVALPPYLQSYAAGVAHAAIRRLPDRVVRAVDAAVAAYRGPAPVRGGARSRSIRSVLQRIREVEGAIWALEAEDMLTEDVRLASADGYARAAIKNARWVWRPGSDTRDADRNADHMNRNFGLGPYRSGHLRRRWRKVLEPITRYIQIGWRLSEPTYHWTWCPETRRYKYWISDLVDMRPTEHGAWIQLPTGDMDGCQYGGIVMRRRDPMTRQPQLVHWMRGGQAGDIEGNRGLLYPARRPYAITKLYDDLVMVGGERWALQSPTVEIDRSLAERHQYSPEVVDQMIAEAFTAAIDYAAGEGTVLVQNPVARMGTYGGQGNFLPSELVAVRVFYDNLKLHSYFAGMLGLGTSTSLGTSETGVKAAGMTLQTAFTEMLTDAAWDISDTASAADGPAAWVLERSYGPQDACDLPYLEPDGLAEDPIADLVNVIPNWLAVDADTRAPSMWNKLQRIAQVTETAPQPAGPRRRRPRMRNLDPAAGGVPARPVAA